MTGACARFILVQAITGFYTPKMMRKQLYALLDFLLKFLSANGTKSYSLGRIRFLTSRDVRRFFPESIQNLGHDETFSVPALQMEKNAFLLEGADHSPDGFLQGYTLRLEAPFSARFEAGDQRKLYVSSGCLLLKDKTLGTFLICPEPKSSRRLGVALRAVASTAPSTVAATAISSWKSCGFGDFGLIMLPKLARVAGTDSKGGVMLPQMPAYVSQYLSLFKLRPLSPEANPRQWASVQDVVEVVFGPGVEEGFVSLRSDIDRLQDWVVPLLPELRGKKAVYFRRAGRRKITNEHELLPLLAARGMEIIEDDHVDVLKQAALFREADFIVAPHGALCVELLPDPLPLGRGAILRRGLHEAHGIPKRCTRRRFFCGNNERNPGSRYDFETRVGHPRLNPASAWQGVYCTFFC
jgi:hypothetical protein